MGERSAPRGARTRRPLRCREYSPDKEPTVQGYCVRCKEKHEMLSATRTLMKNGRRAMIGHCGCCGTQMYVAGFWDGDSAPFLPLQDPPAPSALPSNPAGRPPQAR